MSCSCENRPSVFRESWPHAKREYRCVECLRCITVGELHHNVWGVWDGKQESFRICMHCESVVRKAESTQGFCRLFGELRNEFENWSYPPLWVQRAIYGLRHQWQFRGKPMRLIVEVPAP
jgi:hypothetical protein